MTRRTADRSFPELPSLSTTSEGSMTTKLTVNIQIFVDGVVHSNGTRHPDFDPGMERGGWAWEMLSVNNSPYRTATTSKEVDGQS